MTSPLTSTELFNNSFLQLRAQILDVAATLDRINRCDGSNETQLDPRYEKIQEAIEILATPGFDHAERVQLLFSDAYDCSWNQAGK